MKTIIKIQVFQLYHVLQSCENIAASSWSSFSMIHFRVILSSCGKLNPSLRFGAAGESNLFKIFSTAGDLGLEERSLSIAQSCSDLNHNVGPISPYNRRLQKLM